MKIATIIVAAGSSTRMGGGVPKPYRMLNGKPVLRHCVDAFAATDDIIIAINPDHLAMFEQASNRTRWVAGGATRQESVRLALESLADNPPDHVLIHDAARPFVSAALIDRVMDALKDHVAVIPAIAVVDTIRHVDGHTLNREDLRAAQTPQGFHYAAIFAAHREAVGQSLTDDAAVMEAAGHTVFLVEGDIENRKLTTQADWEWATCQDKLSISRDNLSMCHSSEGWNPEKPWIPAFAVMTALQEEDAALFKGERTMRIGQGFDVHRLIENPARPLMLCGIKIESPLALDGHSDADVGLHALVDAILGAIGGGDIGQHFPPSDAKWKNVDSSDFVAHAIALMKQQGFAIANADVTIICERPKITPHREAMRARVAHLLEVELSQVNIKATTTEGLGFTGRGEGIAAQAVVMLNSSV